MLEYRQWSRQDSKPLPRRCVAQPCTPRETVPAPLRNICDEMEEQLTLLPLNPSVLSSVLFCVRQQKVHQRLLQQTQLPGQHGDTGQLFGWETKSPPRPVPGKTAHTLLIPTWDLADYSRKLIN